MMINNLGNGRIGHADAHKAALILAGAAARGPFAAGALQAIAAEKAFDVRCVVGTSSGALNAAVYAAGLRAGKPELAARRLVDLWTHEAVWWRIVPQNMRKAMVYRPLKEFSHEQEKQRVNLRMIVTSLDGQERVTAGHRYTTFEKTYSYHAAELGDSSRLDQIATVAVASAAIPFVFAPVTIGADRCVDGGLVENAPIAWALQEDPEIDHLLVVTPDPPIAPRARLGGPLAFARRVLEVIVEEQLSRDLRTARSFNEELDRLERLGVDKAVVRRELQWRRLQIIEIRPEHTPAEGGFISGFFCGRQRLAAIRAGEACAERALGHWRETARNTPAVRTVAPLPLPPHDTHRRPVNGAHGISPPATSKHLRGRSEILLIAPIKQGLLPLERTQTYATRLKSLLKVLFELRQTAAERLDVDVAGPLDAVNTLHFVQWGILDQGARLLLAVTFDGPWESYIRNVVDTGGPFLDIIFCHCEGYEGHATQDGYESFGRWVRQHQVECDYFHAAAPDLSADDIRYLKRFERLQSSAPPPDFATKAAALHLPADVPATRLAPAALGDVINAFFQLSLLFTGESETRYFNRATRLEWKLLENSQFDAKPANVSDAAWRWYQAVTGSAGPASQKAPVEIRDIHTVQGNILTAYPDMMRGCLVFLQFDDARAGQRFLKNIDVTRHGVEVNGQAACNIGLTFAGLQTLKLDERILMDLPEEFRQGLQARAPMLGDVGRNHPQNWVLPKANWPAVSQDFIDLSTIDAVAILQGRGDNSPLDDWIRAQIRTQIEGRGARVLGIQALERHELGGDGTFVEHFGFRDGYSQPAPRATNVTRSTQVADRDLVAVGEILLGYDNERSEPNTKTYGTDAQRVVKNGSFLAMRKLKQNVEAFHRFVDENVKDYEHGATSGKLVSDAFKAKLMGRFPDGKPLIESRAPDAPNDFDYSSDSEGKRCPFFAHIRRANPRVNGQTPRIVRRGFSYGSRYDEERREDQDRGLVFMAYCASLGQQFEVIQGWVNGGNSTGTLSSRPDPLMLDDSSEQLEFVHPEPSDRVVRLKSPEAPFVKVEWGLYLLVPSTDGLAAIADLATKATADPADTPRAGAPQVAARCPMHSPVDEAHAHATLAQQGRAICADLDALNSSSAWQAALEELLSPQQRQRAAAIWAAIRQDGGLKLTPYGLLVATAERVANVFSDDSTYSVREYAARMSQSLGLLYLGLDGGLAYARSCTAPNEFIRGITRRDGYQRALTTGRSFLKAVPQRPSASGEQARRLVSLQVFADQVVGRLAADWFGAPDPDDARDSGDSPPVVIGSLPVEGSLVFPGDFRIASEYIFEPRPSDGLAAEATRRHAMVHEIATRFAQERREAVQRGQMNPTLMDRLVSRDYGSDEEISRAWLGAVNGFSAPTGGSFLSVMTQWINGKQLWRLQQQLRREAHRSTEPPLWLELPLLAALRHAPVPDLLHRELTQDRSFDLTRSDGRKQIVHVPARTRVVVSLASAAADPAGGASRPWVLFGGADEDRRPPEDTGPDAQGRPRHPCPGREQAVGVIMGMLEAILRQRDLRDESNLCLSFVDEYAQGDASGARDSG